jgi:hypothetical protein
VATLAATCSISAAADAAVRQAPAEHQMPFAPVTRGEFIAGRLIVRFHPQSETEAPRGAAKVANANTVRVLRTLNAEVLHVRPGTEGRALERLRSDPAVIDAERDPIEHGEATSSLCTPSLTCSIPTTRYSSTSGGSQRDREDSRTRCACG